jgi:hypothetical protein
MAKYPKPKYYRVAVIVRCVYVVGVQARNEEEALDLGADAIASLPEIIFEDDGPTDATFAEIGIEEGGVFLVGEDDYAADALDIILTKKQEG